MKNYKNEYGTVYAVMLDKHNHPAIMASDPSDGWVVSGTLAPAVAAAEAKTHEELQTVLDTEAEERGWVSCNLPGACDNTIAKPTDAAEEAAVTEPTESVAPASVDDVCGNCVCRECDDERCLQAHCDCRDKGMGCWKPDDDCRHDHPELFPEADKQVDAQRPTSSAAATAAVVTAAEVPAHADAANTMEEPAAPLSEQTDDADGSALAASTGSAMETFDFTALGDDAAEAADDDAQFTAHIGRSREE